MKIGLAELLVVFIAALVLIGPDKLPGFAKKVGAAVREFKKATADVTKEVRENIIDPLEEAQKPLREAAEPLKEADREVRSGIRDLEREFRDIGKAAPAGAEPGTSKSGTAGDRERKGPGAEPEDTEEPISQKKEEQPEKGGKSA